MTPFQGLTFSSEIRGIRAPPLPSKQLHFPVSSAALYTIVADGGRKPWDFGRFLKTVTFFNEPPTLNQVTS